MPLLDLLVEIHAVEGANASNNPSTSRQGVQGGQVGNAGKQGPPSSDGSECGEWRVLLLVSSALAYERRSLWRMSVVPS